MNTSRTYFRNFQYFDDASDYASNQSRLGHNVRFERPAGGYRVYFSARSVNVGNATAVKDVPTS